MSDSPGRGWSCSFNKAEHKQTARTGEAPLLEPWAVRSSGETKGLSVLALDLRSVHFCGVTGGDWQAVKTLRTLFVVYAVLRWCFQEGVGKKASRVLSNQCLMCRRLPGFTSHPMSRMPTGTRALAPRSERANSARGKCFYSSMGFAHGQFLAFNCQVPAGLPSMDNCG